jgi:hypothetical protein
VKFLRRLPIGGRGGLSHRSRATQSAVRQRLTQGTHEPTGQADTRDIQRFWLRRELRNHDLVLAINEEVLTMNA